MNSLLNRKKQCELLAPAGSYDAVLAAVNAGADAVYLGAEKFSARAFADNLNSEQLVNAIRLCHFYNVRVYLTLNILIKNTELDDVIPLLKPLYESGLDGVIVQDLGVGQIIKQCFPDMELHASTQMSIMNSYGAKMLSINGYNRIVPARELTLKEVKEIIQATGAELECFIHGAMCYSYSGLCLMSSMIGCRSGNRGKCAGTCRLPFSYHRKNGKNMPSEYPLSMKDMCTIEYIPKLIDAGIYSFKIEGRMKSPEYVAGVTSIYRKYIDKYLNSKETYSVDKKDIDQLRKLYIRTEISQGYYEGQRGRKLITLDAPGYAGSDEKLISRLTDRYVREPDKKPVSVHLYLHKAEPAQISFTCHDITENIIGDIVEEAKNAPLSKERVFSQLNKLGDTYFYAEDITIDMDADIFMPMGRLNELRRKCAESLTDRIISENGFSGNRIMNDEENINHDLSAQKNHETCVDVSVIREEQYKAACIDGIGRIYLDHNLFMKACSINSASNDVEKTIDLENAAKKRIKLFISMPPVFRPRHQQYYEELTEALKEKAEAGLVSGILIHTLDQLAFAKEFLTDFEIATDASIYLFNKISPSHLMKLCSVKGSTLPHELTLQEMYPVKEAVESLGLESQLLVYGRLPMMFSDGCLKNTYNSCDHCITYPGDDYIRDRKNSNFPIYSDCTVCTNVIYNDRPLSFFNCFDKIAKLDCTRIRLDMTTETGRETGFIINAFLHKAGLGKTNDEDLKEAERYFSSLEYTTGHLKREV